MPDPLVMQCFPNTLTGADSNAIANRFEAYIEQRGHGFWAAELLESGQFIGFVGLKVVPFEAHFTPATEVGWRLARLFWNRGYATEAARVALVFGFDTLKLHEMVAFTAVENSRSRRVMEKLGMTHNPADDFDQPKAIGLAIRPRASHSTRASLIVTGAPEGRAPVGTCVSVRKSPVRWQVKTLLAPVVMAAGFFATSAFIVRVLPLSANVPASATKEPHAARSSSADAVAGSFRTGRAP
jgi:RimJ/RimL family protein N-acetyltransferase